MQMFISLCSGNVNVKHNVFVTNMTCENMVDMLLDQP